MLKFTGCSSWQAQHLVEFMSHFSCQAQHPGNSCVTFRWHSQHVVEFEKIPEQETLSFSKESARGGGGCSLHFPSGHSRIMVGSVVHWEYHFTYFQ